VSIVLDVYTTTQVIATKIYNLDQIFVLTGNHKIVQLIRKQNGALSLALIVRKGYRTELTSEIYYKSNLKILGRIDHAEVQCKLNNDV
jgi:hypothetical protein